MLPCAFQCRQNTTDWWRREYVNQYIFPVEYTPQLAASIREQIRMAHVDVLTDESCNQEYCPTSLHAPVAEFISQIAVPVGVGDARCC